MVTCRGCNKGFKSVTSFDKHRVGKFNVRYDRRCLSIDEMVVKGFHCNDKGVWSQGTMNFTFERKVQHAS